MMHEREKSDPAVVAVKLANKAERSAAESVEPRAGTEGNAGQHSTCRAQYRVSVSPALERIRHVRRQTPEVGAVCGKAARTVLCGGRSAMSVPTASASDLGFTRDRIARYPSPIRASRGLMGIARKKERAPPILRTSPTSTHRHVLAPRSPAGQPRFEHGKDHVGRDPHDRDHAEAGEHQRHPE